MRLNKVFYIECAHYLPSYNGKCERMHGHSYKVIVSLEGDVDPESGLVMDFMEMKRLFKEKIDDPLDHTLLNDMIPNPSAENIAIYIWSQLMDFMPLSRITVYETRDSYAEYEGEYHREDKKELLTQLLS